MEDLSKYPNIGPVLAEKLAAIGIQSHSQLAATGSVEAVLQIGDKDMSTCYSMLYAIEGAIQGVRWFAIPKEERALLKKTFDELAAG